MRTCPWCEGRRIVGRQVNGEMRETFRYGGRLVPVVDLLDAPCGQCGGTGQMGEDRYRDLTRPRPIIRG